MRRRPYLIEHTFYSAPGPEPPGQEWPRPRLIRHVWVLDAQQPLRMPHQGLVLEWRRLAYRWSAFVAYVILIGDHHPERVVTEWLQSADSVPARATPTGSPGSDASVQAADGWMPTAC